MEKHIKILGSYLMFVSLAHICLYIALNILPAGLGWLFYYDARIAFFVIEAIIKGSEGTPPALISWIIELGIFALGILMFSGRAVLKTFVVLESLLMLPYLLFFAIIIGAGMSSSHGFSPAELLLPSIIVIINSLLPLSYAIWILWRSRQKGPLSLMETQFNPK
jgi:hypothetical protein